MSLWPSSPLGANVTLDSIRQKDTFEAVKANYTFNAVGTLRVHLYVHWSYHSCFFVSISDWLFIPPVFTVLVFPLRHLAVPVCFDPHFCALCVHNISPDLSIACV